jgi:voltage-gated potassium channel
MILIMLLIGCVGYTYIKIYIEHETPSLINMLYWSVVTLSTLGYYPSNIVFHSTIGMIFTIIYVLGGISVIFGGLPTVVAPWIESRIQKAVSGKIIHIPEKDHVIVCGYNDICAEIIRELEIQNIPFVLVEEKQNLDKLKKTNIPLVVGTPENEDNLKKANISSAISLITVENDENNAFIIMTAKRANPLIRTITIVNKQTNKEILEIAGASVVITPKNIIGSILAEQLMNDYIIHLWGDEKIFGQLKLAQLTISGGSLLENKTLKKAKVREKTGVIIIGIYRDNEIMYNPPSDIILKSGDTIVVMGEDESIKQLKKIMGVGS